MMVLTLAAGNTDSQHILLLSALLSLSLAASSLFFSYRSPSSFQLPTFPPPLLARDLSLTGRFFLNI
ncbi:hypothetical protein Tco_1568691 [Tanacetum coccineum]